MTELGPRLTARWVVTLSYRHERTPIHDGGPGRQMRRRGRNGVACCPLSQLPAEGEKARDALLGLVRLLAREAAKETMRSAVHSTDL